MPFSPIDKVLYTARAHTTGGREGGSSRTDDGHLNVRITPPGHGDGTNPEQLMAAGWSTCFLSAIKLVAGQRKVRPTSDIIVDAEIHLGTNAGGYQLRARLTATIPGVDRNVAQGLLESAHQICPYSKATRGNIDVTLALA